MNPFQAIMGAMNPMQGGQAAQTPAVSGAGFNPLQGLMGRVQQMAGVFQNPQRMIQQCFPDAPTEVQGDPEQLLNWMQQTGKVNPQMVQMARSMMGGR